jgi:hypothetical protein
MARRVLYANGNTYPPESEGKIWRQNSSLQIVQWLNSLPGSEYEGKLIKEIVNFQVIHRQVWECMALVELED